MQDSTVRVRGLEAPWDPGVIRDALGTREYKIWNFRGKTVVDIGAHLGGFSVRAARRGAKAVWSFEANPANVEVLRRNCAKHPNIIVEEPRAIVGAGGPATLILKRHRHNTSPCSMSVLDDPQLESEGIEIPTLSFDKIAEAVGKPIDILKLDCEGSEYDILMTSERLRSVRYIIGEWHRFGTGQDPHTLKAHLESRGFRTRVFTTDLPNGIFTARRRP